MNELISTDVLGDSTRLARDDLGLSDIVADGGLALIDVTHDRDDRRAIHVKVNGLYDHDFRLLDDFDFLVESLVLVTLFTVKGEPVDLGPLDQSGILKFELPVTALCDPLP